MQWLARHRLIALALICSFWTGFIFLGRAFPRVPFISSPWTAEQGFEDVLRRQGRKTPERQDFIFVGVDQTSRQLSEPNRSGLGPEEIAGNRALELMAERPFPWSREIWALFLDKMFAAGARLVMFDMIFNAPNDGDPAFAAALQKYRDRVVIGANIDIRYPEPGHKLPVIVYPNNTLIPGELATDDRVGYVNYWPDWDTKVRALNFHQSLLRLAELDPAEGDEIYTSFIARALNKIGHAADVPDDFWVRPFRFGPADAYPPNDIWKVFFPKTWEHNLQNGAVFKDKVVIVGDSSQIGHDVVDTPISPATRGPALHLHAMAAAIKHEYLLYHASLASGPAGAPRRGRCLRSGKLFAAAAVFLRRAAGLYNRLFAGYPLPLRYARVLPVHRAGAFRIHSERGFIVWD